MSYSVPDGNIGAEKRVRSVKHLCKRDGGTSACLMTTTVEHTAVAQHRCIVLACNARRNVNVTVYEALCLTHSEQTTFTYYLLQIQYSYQDSNIVIKVPKSYYITPIQCYVTLHI